MKNLKPIRKATTAVLIIRIVIANGFGVAIFTRDFPTQAQLVDSPWPMFHHNLKHTDTKAPDLKWSFDTNSLPVIDAAFKTILKPILRRFRVP